MSETYDTYENWEDDEGQDSPLALVGILVMALTGAAIIANALFMQPKSAEIELISKTEKQAISQQTTGTIAANKNGATSKALQGDKTSLTLAIQRQLTMAGYYMGPLDGLEGAQTREAIQAYQDAMGMPSNGRVSIELYDILSGKKDYSPATTKTVAVEPTLQSGNDTQPSSLSTIAALPKAKPLIPKKVAQQTRMTVKPPVPAARQQVASAPVPPENIPTTTGDPIVQKVQAALKKVGYANLTVDGVMGSRTKAAIADFQRSRGMPVTGTVNDRLLQDMMIMGYLDLG